MTCYADQSVTLSLSPVEVPRRHSKGAIVDTHYQARASCGWTSRSIGPEDSAWAWARKHAYAKHHAAPLVECEPNRHIENRRTGFCRVCGIDMWPEDRRLAAGMRELAKVTEVDW